MEYPTIDEIQEMDDNQQGWCVNCGEVQDGCEPDACKYKCESCDKYTVYGSAWLAVMGWVK
ncbi:MAG: hypothetical protein E6Q97_07625 [Desulfurellales bacterium]|nr:MAG: hypothetical protein E6Q97_07625 [Desulfurellales bacterium]